MRSKENMNKSCDLALADAELDMISGGIIMRLLDFKMPGFRFQYFDSGWGMGTSSWGSVIITNDGKSYSEPGH